MMRWIPEQPRVRSSSAASWLRAYHLLPRANIQRVGSPLQISRVTVETGLMTGWWVTSLCPKASTIQSSQTARFRYDSE
jgi:hypothetical protein